MSSVPMEVVFAASLESESNSEDRVGLFSYVNGQAKVPSTWEKGRPKGSKNKAKSVSCEKKQPRKIYPEFVNLTIQRQEIDRDSRAIIRRYAKLGQVHQQQDSTMPQPSVSKRTVAVTAEQVLKDLARINLLQITGVDPFETSPIALEPYMHDLLFHFCTTLWKNIYSLEGLVGCNPIAEYWLPIAFNDPALLHSFIGCADVYVSGYSTITDASRGLKHLQAAISIVNQRIMEHTSVKSLGTLAVVAGIALLEKGAGNHDHWRVHMQGLKQLVELHGGVECLSSEPLLLNKIYSADLYGSFTTGKTPYFRREIPVHFNTLSGVSFRSDGFNIVQKQIGLDNTIRDCVHQLEDALVFWSEFNDPCLGGKKDATAKVARVRHLLLNVQYTLATAIYQKKQHFDLRDQIHEFCRITLILYSCTLLRERAPSSLVTQQICGAFQHVFNSLLRPLYSAAPTSWPLPLPLDFCVWATFLATMTVLPTESNTKDWLLATFSRLAFSKYADIHGRRDLRSRLEQYLWVPSIHGPGVTALEETIKWSKEGHRR
ncbi:hypothetical protein V494_04482 [Pseudogymnoascus sp. VKM F-4513 (FW-928)]|nr:hypothetical protein V494_04482 [Pseudogymnoascus sp. VKM F-4513 (FW-928)]